MTLPTDPSQQPAKLTIRVFKRADSPQDFELARRVRTEVFIQEQSILEEEEYDEYDDEATHWLVLDEQSEPLATGRMLSYQEGCQTRPVAKIGRIAVQKHARGLKLGNLLMAQILKVAAEEGFDQAILDAQTRVIPFYEKLGFVIEGDEFMDANIPHYRMRLLLH